MAVIRISTPMTDEAVSYTHLDVYKRQVLVIPVCFALIGVGVWVRRRNL